MTNGLPIGITFMQVAFSAGWLVTLCTLMAMFLSAALLRHSSAVATIILHFATFVSAIMLACTSSELGVEVGNSRDCALVS